MRTHWEPVEDFEEVEVSRCGARVGEGSKFSSDWSCVDCLVCKVKREKLERSFRADEAAIIEQMGAMADHHKAMEQKA